ncbi:MAG: type VI secretion system baseplate subunit TssG [Aquabacterium sp.]|nr:MAG: type VI secretion system baseplate subunit TssG [Aquabacterium sp.]
MEAPQDAPSAAPAEEPRRAPDDWWQRLADAPWGADLFQTLRRIESRNAHLPRLGEAQRPQDEPLRLAQEASLTFAPSALTGVVFDANTPPRLVQRVFGLLGPNGPLPIHLTEHARERVMHHADPTLLRFLDMLGHRFGLLFYRAWSQAQPVVGLDRPDDTRYARWLGSLFGIGAEPFLGRDALGDFPKLHFTGRLARSVRDADGLQAWITAQFEVPVQVDQWQGHWMSLARDERTRLSKRLGQGLGRGAVTGERVWDVQHKFRIVIGPLPWESYARFLPDGEALGALQALVRQYVGFEFEWDLKLILRREDIPAMQLAGSKGRPRGGAGALGRSAWMNGYRRAGDADDLVIDVERTLRPARKAAHDTATV